jgi:hypothetical protein
VNVCLHDAFRNSYIIPSVHGPYLVALEKWLTRFIEEIERSKTPTLELRYTLRAKQNEVRSALDRMELTGKQDNA